jgi:hypothetical protein
MADASPALRKQVERLSDALAKDGETKQAAALASPLAAAERTKEMAPSRLARSWAQMPWEALSRNTPVPVDRKTSAPLAELLCPADIRADPPLFNSMVTAAIETIMEERANYEALSAIDLQPRKTCLSMVRLAPARPASPCGSPKSSIGLSCR